MLRRIVRSMWVAVPVVLAACSSDYVLPTDPGGASLLDVPPYQPVTVCKVGPSGSSATFSFTTTGGTVTATSPFTITNITPDFNPVNCVEIVRVSGTDPVTVTVDEIGMSAGSALGEIIVFGGLSHNIDLANGRATVVVDGTSGAQIAYKNVEGSTPPPLEVRKTAAGRYEIPVRWELVKSVNPTSHTGTAGQIAGSSTWSVTATRIEGAATNHVVSGTITVTNPAGGVTQTFSVSDVVGGVTATVSCPTNTLAAGASTTCTYSAAVAGATSNTAVVSSPGFPDVSATASVSYTSSFTGDQTVTLADPRFGYSTAISSTTTVTFPESFPCPSDPAAYTNGTHTRTEVNTATLTGPTTNLSRNASVNITCTIQLEGETATGQGFPWAATQGAPSNWFMYTPWVTTGGHTGISPNGANLIAGQHHIAGRITGTRGTTTSITITLNSDWGFFNAIGNVKINPMSCTTGQPYKSPGQFAVHQTAGAAATSITVTGLPNTACYGIHVDVVER